MKPVTFLCVISLSANVALTFYIIQSRFRTGRAIAEAEVHVSELNERVASTNALVRELEHKERTPVSESPTADGPQPPRRNVSAAKAAAIRRSPEFFALKTTEERQQIDANYAALFRKLNLAPEKASSLTKLLVDIRLVPLDLINGAESVGVANLSSKEQLKIVKEAQAKIYDEVKTLLGSTDFEVYQGYVRTLTERNELERLTSGLRFTAAPLSEPQTEFLVSTLGKLTGDARTANGGSLPFSEPPDQLKRRYDTLVASAAQTLSPEQLKELQRRLDQEIDLRSKRQAIGKQ